MIRLGAENDAGQAGKTTRTTSTNGLGEKARGWQNLPKHVNDTYRVAARLGRRPFNAHRDRSAV
jgi:hypothetical protein